MKTYISDIIDRIGVPKLTIAVFLMCGITMLFDGYDNMIVSYTMPQIAKEWALSPVLTGSLVSWGLLGLLVGGFCAGVLSDAIGRKKTLILSCLLYSLFSGLIYFAQSFETFAVFRVLSGFGLGACLPVSITLVSEYVPTKNRGVFVTSIFAFFLAGWVVAGIVAMFVVPALGWRFCYLIGAVPALYAIVLAIYQLESTRWLLMKGHEAAAFALLNRLERSANATVTNFTPGSITIPAQPAVVGPAALFTRQFLRYTVSLALIYFFGSMIVYGVTGWLPSLFMAKGMTVVKSYSLAVGTNTAAVLAGILSGYVGDRIGRKATLMIGFGVAGIVVVLFGYSSSTGQLIASSVLFGFFANFALTGVQPMLVETYPTAFRNTGVAFSQAFGRLGSMSGPLAAGFAQGIGFGFTGTLAMFVMPAIICVIILLFFKRETKGKTLEVLAQEIMAKK